MVTLAGVAELAEAGDTALGEYILPIEVGLAGMPRVDLDPEQVTRLRHGQRIDIGGPPLDVAVAFGGNGIALGLVEVEAGGIVRVRRLFAAPEPTSQSELPTSRGVPQPEG
jgi:tRNA pseudouridine55 synthase